MTDAFKPCRYLEVGKRLALDGGEENSFPKNWYCGYSPRNDSGYAEGYWDEWVKLAHMILEEDARRREAGYSDNPAEGEGEGNEH